MSHSNTGILSGDSQKSQLLDALVDAVTIKMRDESSNQNQGESITEDTGECHIRPGHVRGSGVCCGDCVERFCCLLEEAKMEVLGGVRVPETVTGTGTDYERYLLKVHQSEWSV